MAQLQAADWVGIPAGHPFGLATLPYGVFSTADQQTQPRIGVAVGDKILDLTAATARLLPGRAHLFGEGTLNPFLAAGDGAWAQVRADLVTWLSGDTYRVAVEDLLVPAASATMHLPFAVADYVDFYASQHHASNVSQIFRPDGGGALAPSWLHQPTAYHGRAGTVIVSGTPVRRPYGQSRPEGADGPEFGPTSRLDFEAELGFVVGVPSQLGEAVAASRFHEYVFGVCLVNDWSARDLQAWETTPLGPFLGKSFGTTVSAWVVPLAALQHAIDYEVRINGHVVSRPPYATMHWSPAQMLAHLTANGAALRTGDLFASGTVSGPERGQRGSLIELSWNGSSPIELADGTSRAWLHDNDEVLITATARGADGERIGLGEAHGQVIPAQSPL
jgi:fumarylacetoacetase